MDNYNNKLNSIKLEIENTRNMLNDLIEHKGFNLLDSEVIKLSQLLDQLLSEYDKIRK
ncbi:Spo0E family sporulation regulatory protein-aspartic acid phosphatase [Tepidibacter hydrothermalis]|uniref:Spo0E family sporulation regulatory protein-aspartic acid phosphatase n=1 Tax=Tepidibacter hydrothermalis TaxID=3036126 RepID=A0ABY8EKC5_9FIRM|nr:Spo0E family sporulation regulatory protein-aspartic acid phosphatase [Tepidibacter hydrothermalis]WFD12424.1 Spo0E family sporulation regulatory protein-aspartic acid phosphatase [Tepidibacter hydrothermalis]